MKVYFISGKDDPGGDGDDLGDLFIPRSLFSQGGLWMSGVNTYGELGTNDRTNRSSPVQTIAGGTNWKNVELGSVHTAAIKTDGTLWTWGRNNFYGELGTNNLTDRSSPVQTISAGTNWKQVSCGFAHSLAIKTDGTLWGWGYNRFGQLALNTNETGVYSPVQTIAAGTNWKQVACKAYNSAAVKTDGTLWTWGENDYGQLGTNDQTPRSSPVQTIAGGTDWKLVACGGAYTAAIKTNGTLWLWGLNNYGQLGTNDRTNRSSPVQTVSGGTNWKQVSGEYYGNSSIKTDGTLWTWGFNASGQLGTNDRTHRSSPVQTISGGTNWKLVVGAGDTTAAIKTDGSLWLWGRNDYGQLGTNERTNRSSPVQTVSGGTNWKNVAAGTSRVAAITDIF